MSVFSHLAVAAIGEHADQAVQKAPSPGGFALPLVIFGGNANRGKLVAIAIQPAGQTQAEGPGIELIGLALAVESNGGDEEALGAGSDELAMKARPKAATLRHAEHLIALSTHWVT